MLILEQLILIEQVEVVEVVEVQQQYFKIALLRYLMIEILQK
jgi:hypothetical protein